MTIPVHKIRISILFMCLCSTYGAIIIKLYYVQIRHSDFFSSLGTRQYSIHRTQRLERALIYDRDHNPLVINTDRLSACIMPRQFKNKEAVLTFLHRHFPAAAARLKEQPHLSFMYIQRNLSEEEQKIIHDAALSDIFLITEPGRFYTLPCLGPLIGITNVENDGAFGLELCFNEQLQGNAMEYTIKRDARNQQLLYFEKQINNAGTPGTPVTITISSALQSIAYEELKKSIAQFHAKEGAVIIMDAESGDILACANYPDFDPNDTRTLCMEQTRNRIFNETYEFGSIIKVFLALAALAEKVVTPDTLIDCHNTKHIILNRIRINNWRADGIIPFSEVIMKSNNIGTTQIACMLQEKLYTHYCACGFGEKTGLLPGEQAGYITPPHTWSAQSLASLSYGYEVRATLLQLACAFCMIAQNGKRVNPRIIIEPQQTTHNTTANEQPLYDPLVMEQIHTMLTRTITSGTAYKAQIAGYHIMGKTGTANVLEDGIYHPNRNLFTFGGIIMQGNYKRVIITFIKETNVPGPQLYASSVTAPLFEHIAERMLIQEKITPAHVERG